LLQMWEGDRRTPGEAANRPEGVIPRRPSALPSAYGDRPIACIHLPGTTSWPSLRRTSHHRGSLRHFAP
jgi:hypothetical protein